jgi:hypothetical protein
MRARSPRPIDSIEVVWDNHVHRSPLLKSSRTKLQFRGRRKAIREDWSISVQALYATRLINLRQRFSRGFNNHLASRAFSRSVSRIRPLARLKPSGMTLPSLEGHTTIVVKCPTFSVQDLGDHDQSTCIFINRMLAPLAVRSNR